MITYEINLLCDTENCCALLVSDIQADTKPTELIKDARALGWTFKRGKACCPVCAKSQTKKRK